MFFLPVASIQLVILASTHRVSGHGEHVSGHINGHATGHVTMSCAAPIGLTGLKGEPGPKGDGGYCDYCKSALYKFEERVSKLESGKLQTHVYPSAQGAQGPPGDCTYCKDSLYRLESRLRDLETDFTRSGSPPIISTPGWHGPGWNPPGHHHGGSYAYDHVHTSTGHLPYNPPPGVGSIGYCDHLYNARLGRDGVYDITLNGRVIEVFCDFQHDGYNWLVFQRRESGAVDFYRDWANYTAGFGDKRGEFWLGLENLHLITSAGPKLLRVNLEDWDGHRAYADYTNFRVGDASSHYILSIGTYHGNASDSLSYHNHMEFSTKDRDNDNWSRNCAVLRHGGWWYNGCIVSHLNGEYLPGGTINKRGITWHHWKSSYYSLKKVEMKLRAN